MKKNNQITNNFVLNLGLVSAISLFCAFSLKPNKLHFNCLNNFNGSFYSSNSDSESNPSLEEEPNILICVLNHLESLKFIHYSNKDFMIDDKAKIEDLTSAYEGRNDLNSQFCRILEFDFSNCPKSSIDRAFDIFKEDRRFTSVEVSCSGSFYYAPNDPYYQTNVSNYQYYLHKISMENAWNIEMGSSNVKVGLIDNGVYTYNEDLDNNRFPSSLLYDACVLGRSAYGERSAHGTMNAGIIAATINNNKLISGMCNNVQIANIRADDPNNDGNETVSSVCRALNFATSNNIPICNFSGGFTLTQLFFSGTITLNGAALRQAIIDYNGLLVVAAGNDSLDLSQEGIVCYPTSWDLDNVISVGSSTEADEMRLDSNYSNIYVDLFAPGDAILSLGQYGLNIGGGTSHAAPQVTACAALLLSKYPAMSTSELKNTILSNVDVLPQLANYCVTGGRLNCYQCLANPVFNPHNHSYNHHYSSSTKYKHKAYCYCNDYQMENHVWDFGSTWYNAQGLLCGYCALCGGTMII